MKILIVGSGRMGQLIEKTAEARGHQVLAMGDKKESEALLEHKNEADVIVDFSHPDNLAWITENFDLPLVEGTTGYGADHRALLEQYSHGVPVFFASNYSVGIALLHRLVKLAGAALPDFDVEIIEKHHNKKADAPSGTALSLLETVDPDGSQAHVFGREGRQPRAVREIGVHAVRGGTLPGEHEVLFLGSDEEVSLTHRAYSRQIFADGALRAAEFVVSQTPGLYDMEDLINEC